MYVTQADFRVCAGVRAGSPAPDSSSRPDRPRVGIFLLCSCLRIRAAIVVVLSIDDGRFLILRQQQFPPPDLPMYTGRTRVTDVTTLFT